MAAIGKIVQLLLISSISRPGLNGFRTKPIFRNGHGPDCQVTGGPSSFHERGRDSCLRAVLCYKRLFTKACMGCKRFFLKERKNVMFLNKINLPYCFVVFFVVCSRLRPF